MPPQEKGVGAGQGSVCVFLLAILFERSEFLIDTSPKKSLHACTRARVHACSTSLGLSVWYYVPYTYVSHISSAPYVPRVCCVIPSYIVSAHLVPYCLLVRQQQRFHHPTLRTSTDFLVGCIEQQCVASSRLLYC